MRRCTHVLSVSLLLAIGAESAIVACLGDSITEGRGVPYPTILGNQLVDDEVLNFGKGGRRAQSDKGNSYRDTDEYAEALDSGADFFVVTLGTNDAVLDTWDEDAYRTAMIEIVESLPGGAVVVVCAPPPFIEFKDNLGDPETSPINTIMPGIVEDVATTTGSTYCDFYRAFGGLEGVDPDLYRDSVHPNTQGNQILADTVYEALPLTRRPTPMPSTPSPSHFPSYAPTTSSPSFRPTHTPTTPSPSFYPSHKPNTSSPSFNPSQKPTTTPSPSSPSADRPTTEPSSESPDRPTRTPSFAPSSDDGGSSSKKKSSDGLLGGGVVIFGIVALLLILVILASLCFLANVFFSRSQKQDEKINVYVRAGPPPPPPSAPAHSISPGGSDGSHSVYDLDQMSSPPPPL